LTNPLKCGIIIVSKGKPSPLDKNKKKREEKNYGKV
jgi:hypothetical protein